MIRVGVDTGGTFTDLVMFDGAALTVHKVRSTPADPACAILAGVADLVKQGDVAHVVHGSTVATNAVLERKGARVALVTTAGFEDALRIGRQTRKELYNFDADVPTPLIEDGLTFGVHERINAGGEVLQALDEEELAALPTLLRTVNVEAVAVCLLHSYANAVHEEQIVQLLEQEGFTVSASHRVLPEYREVERWSTTAVNAYITPAMSRYLSRLEVNLPEDGLSIMQSNGGSISAARARQKAVLTVLSGPAGGAVGARAIARASNFAKVITFDMGGTSTDVSLMDGDISRAMDANISDIPLRLPVIDIHTVGAGGGSIAYLDAGGALRVGPRSAGADPGPVCYGDGHELTVTDANLLLGRLDAEGFLGGGMRLDRERTLAVAEPFAARMGLSFTELAEGIIRVANSNMERAIRVVSVQRGYDPRQFTLLAFGGAGGLHACELADALDMPSVLVPEHGGVLSALGMLLADVTKDYSHTVLRAETETSDEELQSLFAPLIRQAEDELRLEGYVGARALLQTQLDLRYRGQAYEITVPFQAGYREEFDRRHQRLYGYCDVKRALEIVTIRVSAVGVTDKPVLPVLPCHLRKLPAPSSRRPVLFGGSSQDTPVYHRQQLEPGHQGEGPTLLISSHSTTVIPPQFLFRVDGAGSLIASRKHPARGRPSILSHDPAAV